MHGYFICLTSILFYQLFLVAILNISIASKLLLFAALFQLFDGTQVVAIGALRGLEDYKYPTYIAFYRLLANCSSALQDLFAFVMDYKVYGVWLALSIGLGFPTIALSFRIRNLIRLKSISV